MFGQIKRILGIEGVKIDVDVHQPVHLSSGKNHRHHKVYYPPG